MRAARRVAPFAARGDGRGGAARRRCAGRPARGRDWVGVRAPPPRSMGALARVPRHARRAARRLRRGVVRGRAMRVGRQRVRGGRCAARVRGGARAGPKDAHEGVHAASRPLRPDAERELAAEAVSAREPSSGRRAGRARRPSPRCARRRAHVLRHGSGARGCGRDRACAAAACDATRRCGRLRTPWRPLARPSQPTGAPDDGSEEHRCAVIAETAALAYNLMAGERAHAPASRPCCGHALADSPLPHRQRGVQAVPAGSARGRARPRAGARARGTEPRRTRRRPRWSRRAHAGTHRRVRRVARRLLRTARSCGGGRRWSSYGRRGARGFAATRHRGGGGPRWRRRGAWRRACDAAITDAAEGGKPQRRVAGAAWHPALHALVALAVARTRHGERMLVDATAL